MNRKLFYSIKIAIVLIIGLAFIGLENVIGLRLFKLSGLFLLIAAMNGLRYLKLLNKLLYLVLVDLSALLMISLLSRYVINYYLYAMYLLILIEVGLMYPFKRGKYIMLATLCVSGYHYVVLYRYRPNLGTLSEIAFMLLIHILLIFSLFLFQTVTMAREKQVALNQQLQETNAKLEQLTRLAVKTNIAREIHDTFGHDMMGLIMQLEMADVLIKTAPEEAQTMIRDAKQSARQGMQTIRQVVETLRTDEGDIVTETLTALLDRFEARTRVTIEREIDEAVTSLSKPVQDVLYRLVQECLTNSVRHGQADFVKVGLYLQPPYVNFRIKDNGCGSEQITPGYGLTGMKERIATFHGQLRYKNDNGFEVKGYIEVTDD